MAEEYGKNGSKELGRRLCERYEALLTLRRGWETLWQEISRYVIPRRTPGLNGTIQSPNVSNEALLFDGTAIEANMTLANGQLAWMSPLEVPCFAFEPQGEGNDGVKMWLADATEQAREQLAISNFYTAVHEFYLDRGAFGTACLYVEPGKKNAINAQVWPVGTFVVDEDDEGNVDTVIREFSLTARQAVQKFGEDGVSQKVRERFKKGGSAVNEKECYLHVICPREDAERDKAKIDDRNMPIASIYVEKNTNYVCRVSGFPEMPAFVSRYLEWGSGLGSLYGWCPAFAALPESRQVNFLQKMGDALAEKAAFPPMLIPEELEGEVDSNAMGMTYFSAELSSGGRMPKEWQTEGRYDVLVDRIKMRQDAINRAFHVDLFQMFAQLEKQMTAREVAERSQEKLIQFSPTFSRLTSELFNPLLERVVGIMGRGGLLGVVPPELEGVSYQIQYKSRIALALRSLPSIGYARSLERLALLAPVVPSVLDNYDFDKAERESALIDGVPPDYLRKEADVKKIREERAAAQAQAAQQQQAMVAAEAASKVGGIPADSPVGKIIDSQLGNKAA